MQENEKKDEELELLERGGGSNGKEISTIPEGIFS